MVKQVTSQLKLPQQPRVAVSGAARAETLVGIQKLYPEARFSSATALLNPLRQVKSEAEIEIMREAGVVTEGGFHLGCQLARGFKNQRPGLPLVDVQPGQDRPRRLAT